MIRHWYEDPIATKQASQTMSRRARLRCKWRAAHEKKVKNQWGQRETHLSRVISPRTSSTLPSQKPTAIADRFSCAAKHDTCTKKHNWAMLSCSDTTMFWKHREQWLTMKFWQHKKPYKSVRKYNNLPTRLVVSCFKTRKTISSCT